MMRTFLISCLGAALIAAAAISLPTNADARRARIGYRVAPPLGPGLGLPGWGWRGQGWDGYYAYNPAYYGYGCYRPVLFYAPPPLGLSWQERRVRVC
jgi:hypothetical protein